MGKPYFRGESEAQEKKFSMTGSPRRGLFENSGAYLHFGRINIFLTFSSENFFLP